MRGAPGNRRPYRERKLLQGHLEQRSLGEAAGPVAGTDGVEVRRRVAEAAASRSFDEALFDLSRSTAAEVPKRQAEHLVARAAEDFDAFYEARRAAAGEPPPEGSVVVLTFDGKGVVLHREDLREATRRAAEKRRQQREPLSSFRRLQPGEKKRAKRMASRTCRARIPARMLQNAAPIAARMATLVPMIVFDGTASEPHPSASSRSVRCRTASLRRPASRCRTSGTRLHSTPNALPALAHAPASMRPELVEPPAAVPDQIPH